MENPIAAKNGFIVISNTKKSEVHHMDRTRLVDMARIVDSALPIKWKQAHMCQGSGAWPYVASIGVGIYAQVMSALGGKEKIVLHYGSQEA